MIPQYLMKSTDQQRRLFNKHNLIKTDFRNKDSIVFYEIQRLRKSLFNEPSLRKSGRGVRMTRLRY